MVDRFKLRRTLTAGRVPLPSEIEEGELAINLPDQKLYSKNGSTVFEIGGGSYASSSVQIIAGTGLIGGGDLTTSRTLSLTGANLNLANLSTTGLVYRGVSGFIATRTLQAGTNITISSGDGSSNPVINVNRIGLDADRLDGLEGAAYEKILAIAIVTGDYSIPASINFVKVTGTNPKTIRLPSAISAQIRLIRIKNRGTGVITVRNSTDSTDTIDGLPANKQLVYNSAISLISDGINDWSIV